MLSAAVWLMLSSMLTSLRISGGGSFPKPLTAEEERMYLQRSAAGDLEARNILIERNLRLVAHIMKKYYSQSADQEDLISIGTIGLMKAINTFHADRNIKLATYASRCIENEILMFIRKTAGQKSEMSIDEPLNVDWDGNELLLSDILGSDEDTVSRDLETREEQNLIHRAVAHLEPRERTIIEMRFGLVNGQEQTQKEVAARLGISQSYISRLEKKIIARLRREITGSQGA